MRDQIPIIIDDFMGLFDRGPNENCPINYSPDCSNIEFIYKGFRTRGEFADEYTFTAVAANILGLYIYPRIDGTERRLILVRQIGGGNPVKLYDIDHPATPFLVATFTTDIDAVSVVTLNDRLYIAPLTTNCEHSTDEIISVYNGTDVARDAGGLAPSGATMTRSEPGAGNISAGLHLIAVAFESESGYITVPGPEIWTQHTAAGSKNVNVAGILTGPAGTVARRLLATKMIPSFSGDQEDYELFFIPTGRIPDNVTTTLTVNFFDSELVDSADYLLDQLQEIPAGPLFVIQNSLGVAGYRTTSGTQLASVPRSIALISRPHEFESFLEAEGFVMAKPGYGGNLYNGLDLNGTMYLFKEYMTLMVQPDVNTPPVDWPVAVIDSINGTGPFGIATYMGIPFVAKGGVAILTKAGLQFFNGEYTNLSEVIDERWLAASGRNYNKSIAVVDPVQRRIYCMLVTSGVGDPNTFLVADYKLGFDPKAIKWCPWTISNLVFRGMVNGRDGAVKVSDTAEKIRIYVERVGLSSEPIVAYFETAFVRFHREMGISQISMILLDTDAGLGPIELTLKGKDDINVLALPNYTPVTGKYTKILVSTFTDFLIRLRLETDHANVPGSFMVVHRIGLYGSPYAEELPE